MKNRTIISILLSSIITVSCNESNSELKKINVELRELQKENFLLKDSLSKIKQEDWTYKMLIGIPEGKLKVGEKNRIFFYLYDSKELQNYDVYKVDNKKEIKIRSEKLSEFSYEYIPKSEFENKVNLKIKIPNSKIEILNETTIPLK